MAAKDFKQRIINTVQSGINTVQSAMVQQQHMGSTAFYPATLDQMDSVKCGWLRKQGGVVRSWHRRWFVLKGDYLCYYTSDEDYANGRQPLGSIFLPGNHVAEVPYSPADSEKFQFEISSGDGDRITTTHDTYLMSAESEEERKEWLFVIKQILYKMIGGELYMLLLAIFGQPLDVTLQFEQRQDKKRKVPQIVECCVKYLQTHGLKEEGLFRLPGRNVIIRQLCEKFDRGERPSLQDVDQPVDVHSVASLLKAYLRDLPQPLIPFSVYEDVMRVITREREIVGEDEAVAKLARIMNSQEFSPPNYNTLQYLSRFLAQVSQHSEVNKMNSLNLATVFVQSFIRPELDDPNLMLATSSQRTVATLVIIDNHDKIFTTEFTHSGTAIVLGDLLGLNSDYNASDTSLSSSQSINNDLAGLDLDFTTSTPSVMTNNSVIRRSRIVSSHELLPPGGKRSNNRGGIVESDEDGLDVDDVQSILFNDRLLSRDNNTLQPIDRVQDKQRGLLPMETNCTVDSDEASAAASDVIMRTKKVQLRPQLTTTTESIEMKSNEVDTSQIAVSNARPALLPKPRKSSVKRQPDISSSELPSLALSATGTISGQQSPPLSTEVITGSPSPVSTSVHSMTSVTCASDCKLRVDQLINKLELVERERDVAIARVKELEQELLTYRTTR